MKQKIFAFTILFICSVLIYPFCVTAETNMNQQRVQQSTVQKVVVKHSKPQATNTNIMYVVKFKIHQTTYTLSLGDLINDPKLKMGSLIMNGDFSALKIYISGKSIKKR